MSVLKCQSSARTVEFESRGIVIPDKYLYCKSMEWYILKILSGYQMSLHTEPKKHWQLNQQWAKGYETSLQSLSIRHGTRCIACAWSGIFFTNFSIRPSKMIKRHNFCKGFPSQMIKGWGRVFLVGGKNFKNLEKYLPLKWGTI